jgi:hypothetical protein
MVFSFFLQAPITIDRHTKTKAGLPKMDKPATLSQKIQAPQALSVFAAPELS